MAFLSQPGITDEIRTRCTEPITDQIRSKFEIPTGVLYINFFTLLTKVFFMKLCPESVNDAHFHA